MTEGGEFADQDFRQILVELQLHIEGAAGTGKSSSAEAAA
jgi:MoxR-like ATPase